MSWNGEFIFTIVFISIFQGVEEEKILSVRDLPGKKKYAKEFVDNDLTG